MTNNSNDILFTKSPTKSGFIGEITLNRPQSMNALTLTMCRQLCWQLTIWQQDTEVNAILIKSDNQRAFCAGGDIRQLFKYRYQQPKRLFEFFWYEYRLNAIIYHLSKPYIALLDHITMGGGAGITIHGKLRIASDNLQFAMPETKIGFYPDVGAFHFLNKCPGHTGLYLALTGNSIDATTAYQLGLVTHVIPQNQFNMCERTLKQATSYAELANEFSIDPGSSSLSEHFDTINTCFNANSITTVIEQLEQHSAWANSVAQQLKQRSPTSLKITFEAYKRCKSLSFNAIMQLNFDLTQQFLIEKDFFEGIRATLIDKDQSPQWQPEVSDKKVEQYFAFKGQQLLMDMAMGGLEPPTSAL